MEDLVWSHVLSVGNDEIDADHHKLVDLLNMLNQSVSGSDSPEYIAAVLEELINCTAWHFSHEERLMVKHSYEGYEEHKADHRELIEGARQLQQKILGSGTQLAEDELLFLERWLTEHILTDDMRLGSFLAENA